MYLSYESLLVGFCFVIGYSIIQLNCQNTIFTNKNIVDLAFYINDS